MTFLYYIFISVHIIACLFLIAIVLLQQGKGQDLASAFGGGGSQTAFGPRGSATVLSRATTVLAAVFMVTSLGLSMFKTGRSSVLDQVEDTATVPGPMAEETPAETAPPAPPAADDTAGSTAEEPAPPETTEE